MTTTLYIYTIATYKNIMYIQNPIATNVND
jgi:hypothetical protein